MGQHRNVFLAIDQRRQGNPHHVQAIVEIVPKLVFLDELFQITIRRGNDAHVDFDGHGASHASNFLILHDPQQLHL